VPRHQQHGDPGARHGALDLGVPVASGRDPAVVPHREPPLRLEDGQVLDEPVFPPLVPVGVADEDSG